MHPGCRYRPRTAAKCLGAKDACDNSFHVVLNGLLSICGEAALLWPHSHHKTITTITNNQSLTDTAFLQSELQRSIQVPRLCITIVLSC